jgi:hypothetical protein
VRQCDHIEHQRDEAAGVDKQLGRHEGHRDDCNNDFAAAGLEWPNTVRVRLKSRGANVHLIGR